MKLSEVPSQHLHRHHQLPTSSPIKLNMRQWLIRCFLGGRLTTWPASQPATYIASGKIIRPIKINKRCDLVVTTLAKMTTLQRQNELSAVAATLASQWQQVFVWSQSEDCL